MAEQSGYFEDALSNFVHDVASGGAIRHLVDAGYSVDQIIEKLDFPTSRERVEKTVYKYMMESGILLFELPIEESMMHSHSLKRLTKRGMREYLLERIHANGEENSYMLCPFGVLIKKDPDKFKMLLDHLTARERQYILDIPWEQNMMYHRLNSRMFEIGIQLASNSEYRYKFYFLKSRELFYGNSL